MTGVRTAMLMSMGAVLLVVGGLVAVLFGFSFDRTVAAEHRDKGIVLAKSITLMSEGAVVAAGRQSHLIKRELSRYLTIDEDLRFIYLLGPDRQVLAHTFPEGFPQSLQGVKAISYGKGVSVAPYRAGDLSLLDIGVSFLRPELGTLHIGLVAAHPVGRPFFYWGVLGIIGCAFLAAGGLLSFFLGKNYEKPLAALLQSFNRRKGEPFDQGLFDLAAVGGLAPLAKAARTLQEDYEELDDCCHTLEDRHVFLRHMVESIPYPFHVVDAEDRRILLANSAFAGTCDWLGMDCRQVIGEDAWPEHPCPLEEVRNTGKPVVHELVVGEGDEKKFFELHGYPIFDAQGRVAQMIEHRLDVTASKRLAQSLEVSREALALAKAESDMARNELQDALYSVSSLMQRVINARDFSVRYDNPNLGRCSEIMGCQASWCECYGKDQIRCWQVAGTYCGGEVKGSFAQKYKDCMKCSVFLAATRRPVDHIGEHFNNMMHLLETKNRELENAYEELQAAQTGLIQHEQLAAIGLLASGVAHALGEPLGRISGNLCSLVKFSSETGRYGVSLDGPSAERAAPAGNAMMAQVDRGIQESFEDIALITQVIKSLESFVSGISAQVDERQVDVSVCLQEVLGLMRHGLEKDAVVEKSLASLPLVHCSPSRICQVFVNLLTNAAQAVAGRPDGRIILRAWHDDASVYVSIADNGPGVPPAMQKSIFRPFAAIPKAGVAGVAGLGVAYGIVRNYGGDILLESEEGKGAVFTVRLPVSRGG